MVSACFNFSELFNCLKSYNKVQLNELAHMYVHTLQQRHRGPCMHQLPFISPISQALMRIALMVAHARKKGRASERASERRNEGAKVPTKLSLFDLITFPPGEPSWQRSITSCGRCISGKGQTNQFIMTAPARTCRLGLF